MRHSDIYSSLFWLLAGIGTVAGSWYHGIGNLAKPGPGFLGLIAGALLSLLSIMLFILSFIKRAQEKTEDLWRNVEWSKPLLTVLLLVAYGIFLEYVGFLVATPLILLLLFRMRCPYSNVKIILLSVTAVLCSFLLFHSWLDVPLPLGILELLR
jgi:hypothetical protein